MLFSHLKCSDEDIVMKMFIKTKTDLGVGELSFLYMLDSLFTLKSNHFDSI